MNEFTERDYGSSSDGRVRHQGPSAVELERRQVTYALDHDPRNESPLAALRREAAEVGDEAQVRLCDDALYSDAAALLECERVLDTARALAAADG